MPRAKAGLCGRRFCLGSDDIFQVRLFLHGGKACGIPASSQRFYKEHGGDEPLAVDNGGFLLVAEQILLRAYHV